MIESQTATLFLVQLVHAAHPQRVLLLPPELALPCVFLGFPLHDDDKMTQFSPVCVLIALLSSILDNYQCLAVLVHHAVMYVFIDARA